MPTLNRRSLLAAAALMPLARRAAAFGVSEWRWFDAARARTLPLRLRRPEGNARVPLVLFSHGLGGNLDAGTDWSEAWAAAGIATLHLQHPGSDTDVLRSGGLAALRRAATWEQLRQRAQDIAFVLDELARRSAELPALALDAVGVAGHSFGAHTTLAAAGQRFAQAAGGSLADPRPRAFAAFSPSPGHSREGAFAGITRPMLCLSGTRDGDPLDLAGQDAHDGRYRRQVYAALPAGAKAELWLDGADHITFGGQSRRLRLAGRGLRRLERAPETIDQAERHRALIAQATTDWWRAHLLTDDAARERLRRGPDRLGPRDEWRRG